MIGRRWDELQGCQFRTYWLKIRVRTKDWAISIEIQLKVLLKPVPHRHLSVGDWQSVVGWPLLRSSTRSLTSARTRGSAISWFNLEGPFIYQRLRVCARFLWPHCCFAISFGSAYAQLLLLDERQVGPSSDCIWRVRLFLTSLRRMQSCTMFSPQRPLGLFIRSKSRSCSSKTLRSDK